MITVFLLLNGSEHCNFSWKAKQLSCLFCNLVAIICSNYSVYFQFLPFFFQGKLLIFIYLKELLCSKNVNKSCERMSLFSLKKNITLHEVTEIVQTVKMTSFYFCIGVWC